jgi:hypothetical protein
MYKIKQYKNIVKDQLLNNKYNRISSATKLKKALVLSILPYVRRHTREAIKKHLKDKMKNIIIDSQIENNLNKDTYNVDEVHKDLESLMADLGFEYGIISSQVNKDITRKYYRLDIRAKQNISELIYGIVFFESYTNMIEQMKEKIDENDIKKFVLSISELLKYKTNPDEIQKKIKNIKEEISKKYIEESYIKNSHKMEEIIAVTAFKLSEIYNERSVKEFLIWAGNEYSNIINKPLFASELYTSEERINYFKKIKHSNISQLDKGIGTLKIIERFNILKCNKRQYGSINKNLNNTSSLINTYMNISDNQNHKNYLSEYMDHGYVSSEVTSDDNNELKKLIEKEKKENYIDKNKDTSIKKINKNNTIMKKIIDWWKI